MYLRRGFILASLVCILFYFSAGQAWVTSNTLQKLANIDPAEFKRYWQKTLPAGILPKNFCLIHIKKQHINYYASNKQDSRIITLINAVKKLVKTKVGIPNGYYLISVDDRVSEDTVWPILAFTASEQQLANGKVVLIPDNKALHGYQQKFNSIDRALNNHPWHERDNKIFWRGSLSGEVLYGNRIHQMPRLVMINYAKDYNFMDVGITSIPKSVKHNNRMLDDSYLPLKPYVKFEQALKFKYMLDIDGNSCTFSRMAWLLYSNSLVFKVKSDQKQWYYNKLQPGIHFLEINRDFGNLEELYTWAEENPEQVTLIIRKARELAEQTFNHVAIQNSLKMALIEYNNLIK